MRQSEDEKETTKTTKTTKQKRLCKFCAKPVGATSIFCNLHSKQTKITWPATDELNLMVIKYGYSKTSRLLGVSDNAVRKRLKNHK